MKKVRLIVIIAVAFLIGTMFGGFSYSAKYQSGEASFTVAPHNGGLMITTYEPYVISHVDRIGNFRVTVYPKLDIQ